MSSGVLMHNWALAKKKTSTGKDLNNLLQFEGLNTCTHVVHGVLQMRLHHDQPKVKSKSLLRR